MLASSADIVACLQAILVPWGSRCLLACSRASEGARERGYTRGWVHKKKAKADSVAVITIVEEAPRESSQALSHPAQGCRRRSRSSAHRRPHQTVAAA